MGRILGQPTSHQSYSLVPLPLLDLNVFVMQVLVTSSGFLGIASVLLEVLKLVNQRNCPRWSLVSYKVELPVYSLLSSAKGTIFVVPWL